ncbi:DUF803-domain-containing protein [Violaceomyces palustris]|uniref:DUF803-domain-containing protein n=1 Tax=Violaceomyces palustris TaxID=1673888 RepID=A0ACD0NX67_9BASI|nr:DUF803-domain-containing protein [Violaceomyces palustris]
MIYDPWVPVGIDLGMEAKDPRNNNTRSLIGVAVAVAGNVTISLALNCQKLAHLKLNGGDGRSKRVAEEEEGEEERRLLGMDENEEGVDGRRRYGSLGIDARRQAKWNLGGRDVGGKVGNGRGSEGLTDQEMDEEGDGNLSNGHAGGHSLEDGEDGEEEEEVEEEQTVQGARHDEAGPQGPNAKFLKSKLWWLGIALMTLGEMGNFISYGFAPASLVAPLGAVALLSNVIISPLLLNERFKAADIGGILLAIIGAVTVVYSSKQSDERLGPQALWSAIKRFEFLIYTAISAGVAGFLSFLSTTSVADRWVLVDVGLCAVFGGFTVLSTKGISSLLSAGNPFEIVKYPISYGLALVLAGTAVAQITYLNRALQRFDSREVIPTQFVLFTLSAIIGSAILYREFEDVDSHRLLNFFFGCLTTFAGVFVLTRQNGNGHHAEQTDGRSSSGDGDEAEVEDSQDDEEEDDESEDDESEDGGDERARGYSAGEEGKGQGGRPGEGVGEAEGSEGGGGGEGTGTATAEDLEMQPSRKRRKSRVELPMTPSPRSSGNRRRSSESKRPKVLRSPFTTAASIPFASTSANATGGYTRANLLAAAMSAIPRSSPTSILPLSTSPQSFGRSSGGFTNRISFYGGGGGSNSTTSASAALASPSPHLERMSSTPTGLSSGHYLLLATPPPPPAVNARVGAGGGGPSSRASLTPAGIVVEGRRDGREERTTPSASASRSRSRSKGRRDSMKRSRE